MGFGFKRPVAIDPPWHFDVRRYAGVCLCVIAFYLSGCPQALAQDAAPLPDELLQSIQGVIEVDPLKAIPPKDAMTPEEEEPPDKTAQDTEDIGGADAQAPAGKLSYTTRSEDSQIFLELLLDDRKTVLDQAVNAYLLDETTLVPLGRVAELVDFPIEVDTSRGTASGWFIDPSQSFRLSWPFKTVEIGGKKIPVKNGIVELHLDDIYVSTEIMAQWFPFQMSMNYGELRLYLTTLTDLPFQERAKRRARWDGSEREGQTHPGVGYDPKTTIKLPYRMYSAPAIEMIHSAGINRPGAGGTVTSTSHSLTAQNDLLGMDARMGFGYQTASDGRPLLNGANISLSRTDLDGKILGPLGATRVEIGDISGPGVPLAGSASGRGFTLNNEPYNFVRDASQFRVSGFGPAGWDVEIFQDLELLAFSTIDAGGRYDFASLPLSEGFNLFKIVLYGPNGEKEEKYERFYLGQDMVPEGKFLYNTTFTESSTPLLDLSLDPPSPTQPTVTFSGEYGLTKYLSLTGGYYRGEQGTDLLDGLGTGLRASGGNAYLQLNTFFDKSGGQSSSALVAGNLTPLTGFNLQHTYRHGYDPGVYGTIRSSTAQVSRIFEFKKLLPSFNSTFQVGSDEEEAGRSSIGFLNRLSTNFLGLSLTNELERKIYSDATPDTHNGRISLRYRAPIGTLRGTANYTFHKPAELTFFSLDLQRDVTANLSLSMGMNRTLGAGALTTWNASADWRLDKVRLGLAGSINGNKDTQVGLTMAYNLVPRTITGDYEITGRTEDAVTGRLLVRPFIDGNGNDAFDAGEIIVPGVTFRNTLRGTNSLPGEDGYAIVGGLTPSLANRIRVEEKSITDIYLTPARKEFSVLGKNGVNGPLDFAFRKLGFISGTLVVPDTGGGTVALENVHMILLNEDGEQAAETWSEYDGYFSFESIPVGNYELFFPLSDTLQAHYTGSGEGPKLHTTFSEPELNDITILVAPDRFVVEDLPEDAGAGGEDINNHGAEEPAPEDKKAAQETPLPAFALNLDRISPP